MFNNKTQLTIKIQQAETQRSHLTETKSIIEETQFNNQRTRDQIEVNVEQHQWWQKKNSK